jgi:ClpP class serine protease
MIQIPQVWLGSEESYVDFAVKAIAYYEDPGKYEPLYKMRMQQLAEDTKLYVEDDEDEDERTSFVDMMAANMVSKYGNAGVITIDGPLTTGTSFFNLIFGGTGYDAIAAAHNMLLDDPQVTDIIYDMRTPGGDASGLRELASFIDQASQVKPVQAWVPQAALSAGYWLASATQKISMAELGEVGSIGAIMTFSSMARRLKENGIDVHVVRSGKDKALLHPAEPLSERGRQLMEEKTAHLHGVFISNVARNRPSLAGVSTERWATGATFFYNDAIALNLADRGPVDISQLINEINASQSTHSSGASSMSKPITLSDSAKAALLAGADKDELTQLGVVSEPAEDEPQTPEAQASSEPQTADGGAAAESGEAPKPVPAPVASGKDNSLTSYLEQQNEKLSARVETLLSENNSLKAKVAQHLSDGEALAPIVREACSGLQIRLGQAPSSFEGMSATTLAEQYAALRSQLVARFSEGRTSLSPQEESDKPRNPMIDRLELVSGGKN